jgi:hypothetical protein
MKGVPQARSERDWCSRKDAPVLARRIEQYWADRGRTVKVITISTGKHECCDIRSNICGVLGAAWK